MARSYSVSQIVPSGGVGVPGRIVLSAGAGDVTVSFAGKFWRDSVGGTLPGYTPPTPVGYTLIQATTFDISDNPSYAGRYTVYSPVSSGDAVTNPSSSFLSPNTVIRVNEVVGVPDNVGDDLIGTVSNISTYLISIVGEPTLVIPPTVLFSDRPIDTVGRNGSPWGELFTQNFVDLAQSFAGPTAPANPYRGQLWYDDANNELKLRTTALTWATLAISAASSYRHNQAVPSTTWTMNHNLGLAVPYVGVVQFFVDIGGGVYKAMLPADVSFLSANQMVASFTSAQSGVALIRA